MKLQKRKTIAIDMDGVMAYIEPQLVKHYQQHYGISATVEGIQGLSYEEAFPEDSATKHMLYQPGFFRTIDVMADAIKVIKKLMEHYEVYIVSAATEFPQSLFEKMEWLKEHFPFISWRNIVLCGNKSIINTDYMIDDHPRNLETFSGKGILFHAHHNLKEQRYDRVHNWKEVLDFFISDLGDF